MAQGGELGLTLPIPWAIISSAQGDEVRLNRLLMGG